MKNKITNLTKIILFWTILQRTVCDLSARRDQIA